ncbi:MAG: filamentous hemagglutinin N-terminal domain-containing protein [gamma proteobacterium symbiont of Taylorina sp.]|nr:filamentous hemagglutinin N-terminal domain-containing protein [gamma proteobacterium symbiont of Taylorina sp.]
MKQKIFLYITISFLLLTNLSMVKAEVITDGSTGPAKNLHGPDYIISQDLGSRTGNNLFHSFKTFDINTVNGVSESATFTGSSDIVNIISRVTGGRVSNINGLLKSEVGKADFYFLNPAGIIFGANAQIDVPAAFHVSTADELRFEDGDIFSATDPDKSTLSLSQPQTFGFLNPQPANLTINGSILQFSPQSQVSITAGNIELHNASLISETGMINLVAQGIDKTPLPMALAVERMSSGNLTLDASSVDVSGNGGGLLTLSAGLIELNNSQLFNLNSNDKHALQPTHIQTGHLKVLNGSQISSINLGAGDAANINIITEELTLDGQDSTLLTGIISRAYYDSSGVSGDINIKVSGQFEILNGAAISSDTLGTGDSGTVNVRAGHLIIDGQDSEFLTKISSFALPGSTGQAGNVSIIVEQSLEMLNWSTISSSTLGAGNSGSVIIHAKNLILDSQNPDVFSWIGSDVYKDAAGDAGIVDIEVNDTIKMLSGGQITSNTFGNGNAGTVKVHAEHLLLDNQNSKYFTGIATQTTQSASGHAGNISIAADKSLKILNGSGIDSTTYSSGNAGTVWVTANQLTIDSQASQFLLFTGISSQANPVSSGQAGNIDIQANHIQLLNGGVISVTNGNFNPDNNQVNSITGSLNMDANTIDIHNGSAIYANATGNAPASTVNLQFNDHLQVTGSSQISTAANTNNGGAINLYGKGFINLNDGIITTSVRTGNGGDIDIKNDILIMAGGFIQANTAEGANGGDIRIDAPYLITPYALIPEIGGIERQAFEAGSGQNVIQAAAPEGNPGTLFITSPEMDINAVLAVLSSDFVPDIQIASDPCSTINRKNSSTLVSSGRGGIPDKPENPSAISFGGTRLDQ